MSFPESAESLKAKAHLSAVKAPVLIGVTVVTFIILFCCVQGLVGLFTSADTFKLVKHDAASSEADAAPPEESVVATDTQRVIVVHVGGAVAVSGVYELPEGSRVQAAIDAAGGFAEGAVGDGLNRARILNDGEQIIVPVQPSLEANASSLAGGGVGFEGEISATKININSASLEELDSLDGIGVSTAQRIIADREAQGPFRTIEDLKRVSGIGEKKYAALADSICV
ncbi:MAG: ComEA family DNA-binding protein [Raoultibacter sp.]